jgi:hypothetical protein
LQDYSEDERAVDKGDDDNQEGDKKVKSYRAMGKLMNKMDRLDQIYT